MIHERKVHCTKCGKWLFEVGRDGAHGRVRHGVFRRPIHDNPVEADGRIPLEPGPRSTHIGYALNCTCGREAVHHFA